MAKKIIIYGIEYENTYYYIGKLTTETTNPIVNSEISYQYQNPKLRNVFINNNVDIKTIREVSEDEWYDEKLDEIVKKYNKGNPLVNAQWMLDGKRSHWEGTEGYWKGKKRDINTLKRLSESKYKKLCQYDMKGNLIYIWQSIKDAAILFIGDYQVIKGGGSTKLYHTIGNKTINGHLTNGYYWFSEEELHKKYNKIPFQLNISALKEEELKKAKENRKKHDVRFRKMYTIIHMNPDGSFKMIYHNIFEAAYMLRLSVTTIRKICIKKKNHPDYLLEYGDKMIQPAHIKYPNYTPINLYCPKEVKLKNVPIQRTRKTVIQYKGTKVLNVFNSVEDTAKQLNIKESAVRRMCKGDVIKKKNYSLMYGKKRK